MHIVCIVSKSVIPNIIAAAKIIAFWSPQLAFGTHKIGRVGKDEVDARIGDCL